MTDKLVLSWMEIDFIKNVISDTNSVHVLLVVKDACSQPCSILDLNMYLFGTLDLSCTHFSTGCKSMSYMYVDSMIKYSPQKHAFCMHMD